MPEEFTARRINVVGTSSVGKSTLAASIAALLQVPPRRARRAALGAELDRGATRGAA